MKLLNRIECITDYLNHPARALPLAAASDTPNVMRSCQPLRRVLRSLALPFVALGLGQLVPCAQADVLPVTSGLQCWYDASVGVTTSGTTVTAWADQSPNGHTATRSNGTLTKATNQINTSLPTVQFRGNGRATIAGTMFVKDEYIVFKITGGDWGTVLGSQSRSGYLLNPNGSFWGSNVPTSVKQNGATVTSLSSVGTFMVAKITGNSNDPSVRSGWALGLQEGWGAVDMDLAEIIAYDHALTSTEENLVGGYLTKKYAVSTTYPAYPLMVSVTSPANTQAYPSGSSVTAVATVPSLSGTVPYNVSFFADTGGSGDFCATHATANEHAI